MRKIISFLGLGLLVFLGSCEVNDGFVKTDIGSEYKIVEKGNGKKPGEGDLLLVQMENVLGDSVLMKTVTEDGLSLSPTQGPPILTSVFALCSEGDSVHIRMSLNDYSINTRTFFSSKMDTSQSVIMKFRVTKVVNQEEFMAKKRAEIEARAKEQLEADKKLIEQYIADNNLEAQKTESGLYYVIEKAGRGKKPQAGNFVSVDYTVRLLDGTFIDSSSEELSKENNKFSQGRTYGPYQFALGTGPVIRGWHVGMALLNKGTKAKLLIPSELGYGPNPRPGGGIPPNAVLIFDVELVDITE